MLNIAIDGPSSAGKSTIAKKLAKKLNIYYLDTGAMYRAIAWKALNNNINPTDTAAVTDMMHNTSIDVQYHDGNQYVYIDGMDVTSFIREHRISKASSDVSKIALVREILVAKQQEIAEVNPIVLDGRDITTKVLPHSKNKFFLTASSKTRAKRRFDELIEKGQDVQFDNILKDVEDRDYNDTHRDNSPLTQTADSIYIDSTDLTVDEVVDYIISKLVTE